MHNVGRIASVGTSIFVALAFILPQTMTGKGGGLADGAIAAGYFLVCMAAAAMIAVSTAIWGRVEASRTSQRYDRILLVPLIIVLLGVAMLFVTAFVKGSFR
jgi:4-amino-4-deoxy-L-arabinose transferase-like glycosyltransferase